MVSLPTPPFADWSSGGADDPFAPHDDHHREEADDGSRLMLTRGELAFEARTPPPWSASTWNFQRFSRLGKLRAHFVGDAGQSAGPSPLCVRLESAVAMLNRSKGLP